MHHPDTKQAPKYYTVKRHLLGLIDSLPPGARVPTERELCTRLHTSRTTARRALAELTGEGRLIRRQGAGTFVAAPKIAWPLNMIGFSAQAASVGRVAGSRVVRADRIRADQLLAERLRIRPGAAVFHLERVRLVDDEPLAVEVTFLAADRFPDLLDRLPGAPSLYAVFAETYGVQPTTAEETIETAPAGPREADLLEITTGTPMLVLTRHSFDQQQEPVEFVRSRYRGDRYVFTTRLS